MLTLFAEPEIRNGVLSRRRWLQLGGLSLLGSTAVASGSWRILSSASAGENRNLKRPATRCILLYMWGGPAHQDTWDLKPDGPSETRGEFKPIATTASGLFISEHFPKLARHGDKLAIVRSVTHQDNNHSTSAHAMLTGRVHPLQRENFGPSPNDFPHFGSVLSHLAPAPQGLPTFVSLPEKISTTNGPQTPGQGGGMLGRRYDPFTIDQHPDKPDFSTPSLTLPSEITPRRLEDRRRLWTALDNARRELTMAHETNALDAYAKQALDMISAPEVRKAFDLREEVDVLRDAYGRNPFGQSCLLARRLVEAGVKFVTVYWHRDMPEVDTTWDTHAKNFPQLKDRLMPVTDAGFATLLEDLSGRGLLDDTLVLWSSEFGRTPHINGNGGRDHWGKANSVVFAGGGVPGGFAYGASDATAAAPSRDPVSPADIAATLFSRLGFDPRSEIHDQLGRPFPLAIGTPIQEISG